MYAKIKTQTTPVHLLVWHNRLGKSPSPSWTPALKRPLTWSKSSKKPPPPPSKVVKFKKKLYFFFLGGGARASAYILSHTGPVQLP